MDGWMDGRMDGCQSDVIKANLLKESKYHG